MPFSLKPTIANQIHILSFTPILLFINKKSNATRSRFLFMREIEGRLSLTFVRKNRGDDIWQWYNIDTNFIRFFLVDSRNEAGGKFPLTIFFFISY